MTEYVDRLLSQPLQQCAQWYPIVSLTGPRQSGKSTLLKHVFADYEYVNLENPQVRAAATEDPISFLRNHSSQLIIDEAQYAPSLFSVIQEVSDQRNTTGQYILSGSQNFLLMQNIQQSLAGRVGILNLLPFSYQELHSGGITLPPEDFLIKGGYPRIYQSAIPPQRYYADYTQTYVERDVADLLDVRNKTAFRNFLVLCARQVGQLVNYSSLAAAVGVSTATIHAWLSILEASYIVYVLHPYHANIKKRLTKAPKLYFYDTGLLCALLHISSVELFEEHSLAGHVFENLVVASALKRHLNQGTSPSLFFYRDDSKREIDLLDYTDQNNPFAVEVKVSRTFHAHYANHLQSVGTDLCIPEKNRLVVCRSSESYQTDHCKVESIQDWLLTS